MRFGNSMGRATMALLVALSMLLGLRPAAAQNSEIAPAEIRFMTFNIWVGGELVDLGKVAEAIQAARADIVGVQEPGGNLRRLADLLGWAHVSERMHILSRYPLIDGPGGDGFYVYAQIRPGQVIAISNVHLPSDPYGPYLVRDGETLEAVLQNEADTRMPSLEPFLERLKPLLDSGMPVLWSGDFNTPSHRDWTETMMTVTPHIRYPVRWPVTVAVEEVGFVDTYRAAHPDPAARVGMTWTPGYPVPRLRPNEVVDRIDYVFAGGAVEVLDSQIVGEVGGPDVDIGIAPYPSDHRGVVSTVRVTPAVPPLFAAADPRAVRQGDPVLVHYHAPVGEAEDRLVIVPRDGAPADALMSLPPMEADFFGSVTFGTASLPPGEYAALLVDGSGAERSRSPFWVLPREGVPVIRTAQSAVKAGEILLVEWENAPTNRYDWVGIYPAGESDLYNYLAFEYTRSAPSGSVTFDTGALELAPGAYEVRLMRDDWYVVLAAARFRVN